MSDVLLEYVDLLEYIRLLEEVLLHVLGLKDVCVHADVLVLEAVLKDVLVNGWSSAVSRPLRCFPVRS